MAWAHSLSIQIDKFPFILNLHAVADIQAGSRSCYRPFVRDRFKEISEDQNSAVVILGDMEDDDRPTTRALKRSIASGRTEILEPMARNHRKFIDEDVVPLFQPLTKCKYGIVGVIGGHHWYDLTPINGGVPMTSAEYICKRLEALSGRSVPYLGEMSSWLWLRFHKRNDPENRGLNTLIHLQHGSGGGGVTGTALRKLEMARLGFAGQAFIRAHSCALEAAKKPELRPKDTTGEPAILCRNIAYLNIGSATQGYVLTKGEPEYPERAMMRPGSIGWGVLKVIVRKAHPWEDSSRNITTDFQILI